MEIEIRKLTPSLARDLMELSPGRPYRTMSVERARMYALDMQRGMWHDNGVPIVIERSTGRILDGWHRLMAVVISKCSISFVMVYDPKSGHGYDENRKRSFADYLHSRGEVSCRTLASIILGCYSIENNVWSWSGGVRVTVSQLSQFFYEDEKRRNQIIEAQKATCRSREIIQASVIGPILVFGTSRNFLKYSDSLQACYFFEGLCSGAELEPDSPVLKLRERLQAEKKKGVSTIDRVTRRALTVIAWNKTIRGEALKTLFYRRIGPGGQTFPDIEQASE